jgi:predicted RNA-binding Zn-ribbon protein involved in translation (DUF1610 family)
MKTVLLMILLTLLPAFAIASDRCASCGGVLIWTGETKTEAGHMFKLYKCPSQHAWWFKVETAPSGGNSSSNTSKCPTCGSGILIWTGETYTENGKMWKVYKCAAGHRSVASL